MKMKLQHQYKLEELAHLVVIDAKHGIHHTEWSAIYPFIGELAEHHQINVLHMLDDIAAGIKYTQKLLHNNIQEEKMNYVYGGYPGQGSEWPKSTLGGS